MITTKVLAFLILVLIICETTTAIGKRVPLLKRSRSPIEHRERALRLR